ncbi:MAG: hypothetical protein RL367_1371 [Pseudomonadota bacterium]|jgi:hydroxymethylbilane synthase
MTKTLKLGTRASPLAMAQAHLVRDALCLAHGWGEDAITIVSLTATGDQILDRPLAEVGGKALWTRELDQRLRGGDIDFAVHSMKDVETVRPPELTIAAMLARADVRDRLIGAASIAALVPGARVGTSSPRRTAQLKRMRPDLAIVLLRGNVGTRLGKLDQGAADATLLAAAGLDRLGMGDKGSAIEPAQMIPAPSQGAIGIECRTNDAETRDLLAAIDDGPTRTCVLAERLWLKALGADCHSSVAALAVRDGDQIDLRAEILMPDGSQSVCQRIRFAASQPEHAARLAEAMLAKASPELRALFQR